MIPFSAPLFTLLGDFNQETDYYIDFVGVAILVRWTSIIRTQRRQTWINAPVVIPGFSHYNMAALMSFTLAVVTSLNHVNNVVSEFFMK